MTDFKKLLCARFFFNFGVRVQAVILGWQMYSLTKDPLQLGMIGLTEAIPALSLAIFAGYLVDRSRPLKVYRWVQVVSLLSALVVLVSLLPHFGFSLRLQVLALYVASFLTGTARGFAQPAIYAIVPRLLKREQLSRATAWLSSAMQVASILGPAVGGLAFGAFGVAWASVIPVVGLIVGLSSLTLINVQIEPPQLKVAQSVRRELLSGAVFVWNHPILLPALTLDMISVLFGGVTALLPIYAADILKIGAMGLGVLRAAPAVGSVLMSYSLTRIDMREKAGPWLLTSVAGFGLCMLVFGLSHSFWLSLSVLALSGAFDSVSVVVRSSAVQLVSPDGMRGRISAVNSIFIGSSNELGEFESGVTARYLGTVPAVVLGSLACLATVAWLGFRSVELRRLNLKKLEAA